MQPTQMTPKHYADFLHQVAKEQYKRSAIATKLIRERLNAKTDSPASHG